MSCHPPARKVGPYDRRMALTTGEQNSSPYTDLHVKPYAQRHFKVYADNSGTLRRPCDPAPFAQQPMKYMGYGRSMAPV
jgi:hypothetical protein